MKHEIEQGLHEKLCAYLLGEASDEVRAEVEAALAGSAELREEREYLEKTIGLVQETMALVVAGHSERAAGLAFEHTAEFPEDAEIVARVALDR